jgi:hypothetical protein
MPTFRSSCTAEAPTFHELRKVLGIGKLVTLVPLSDLKFLVRICRLRCRYFKSAALVWRFRSPHHHSREFVMRTSEPKATLESEFASVLPIPKFASKHRLTMRRTSESGHWGAWQAIKIVSLSKDEHRDAVYRSLHDGSKNQPLLRLRTHPARDRALAPHRRCRAARNHGAIAGADGASGIGTTDDGSSFDARLMKSTRGLR